MQIQSFFLSNLINIFQKKSPQNLQQEALKLSKAEPCPPKPPVVAISKADSSSSSSDPPESNSNLKWILIGGAIAAGAGFVSFYLCFYLHSCDLIDLLQMFYQNSMSKDDSKLSSKSAASKKGKKPEKCKLTEKSFVVVT